MKYDFITKKLENLDIILNTELPDDNLPLEKFQPPHWVILKDPFMLESILSYLN